MDIQQIEFLDSKKSTIKIVHSAGVTASPWPCRTWHQEFIKEWLGQGNEIKEFNHAAEAREEVRVLRNLFLSATDWTQLADAELTDEQKVAWKQYRHDLRRVPQQTGFPHSVEWPAPPATS